ncbi:hypothetical protein EII17_07545 [Clostridiales bacterium COT073_COT-073]|nr:hypothetical protein EII17_07545 [Clostridiales bacterium COT073_COT-073]
MKNKAVAIILMILLEIHFLVVDGLACTGFYIGAENSENGSSYYGRSEDIADNYCKIFGAEKAWSRPENTMYEDIYGFQLPYGGKSYAYTYVKDAPVYGETIKDSKGNYVWQAYAAAGVNEKGVSVSATVSTECNEKAGEADPLVADGIREISIPSVLLGKAETARQAVEYLANIIDEYGAGECNSLMIGDTEEVWYFEIVSGHQYAAIKLPKDKVSVQPNIMLLGVIDINDHENVVVSDNLVNTAREYNFLVTDDNGKIDVAASYGKYHPDQAMCERYLQGICYLNSAAKDLKLNDISDNHQQRPLLFQPDKKISTLEVLRLTACRGEGTAYNANNGSASYAIGNSNQVESHVFEIRENYPIELATLQWQAMADAEYSIFIPYYSALVKEVNNKYNADSKTYVKDSLNWVFSEINAICYDYRAEKGKNLCGENIIRYFTQYQARIIQQQAEIDKQMLKLFQQDKELAARKADLLGIDLADQVYQMADSVLTELREYISAEEQAEAFVPSAMQKNLMPIYSFDRIKGQEYNIEREISKDTDIVIRNSIVYRLIPVWWILKALGII